jgi:hypothetical protein
LISLLTFLINAGSKFVVIFCLNPHLNIKAGKYHLSHFSIIFQWLTTYKKNKYIDLGFKQPLPSMIFALSLVSLGKQQLCQNFI